MKKMHIGKSMIAGRGVFADEDIAKGEFVTPMHGKVIHRVYRTKSDLNIGRTWVPVKKHWWVNPTFPIKYMNHSCEPNIGFKTPRRLYALRKISKGEELTIDYSTIEYVDYWRLPCHCGAPNCRKEMYSIQFLPKKIYKSYLPYIPCFLQKIYLDYNDGTK